MRLVLVTLASVLCASLVSPAWADKDKDKDKGHGRGARSEALGAPPQGRVIMPTRDRGAIYTYYRTESAAGRCPPGLAKKGNGCLPPGQAQKRWVVGQRLPPAVVYYPLPPVLVQQLAPPPRGYEYVRVDNDVLLMDMANRLIADFISDLYDLD